MTDITVINTLLSRTHIKTYTKDFNTSVEELFPIGHIEYIEPIAEGYEDANFLLSTKKGKFVLKLFLTERSKANIYDYANVIQKARIAQVPVPRLIESHQGEVGLLKLAGVENYCMLTEFFEGKNFQDRTPTIDDIQSLAHHISRLNTLNFDVTECYDSWGNKNLVREFDKHAKEIPLKVVEEIKPIVEACRMISIDKLSRGVIHGDMQRKHVLQDDKGNYCILDFGCMSLDAKVIDLSTFLAWFCLGSDTWKNQTDIFNEVVRIYQSTHHLSDYEISLLPLLTRASYAAYYMVTSLLIKEGDNSQETLVWHTQAKDMLENTRSWQ